MSKRFDDMMTELMHDVFEAFADPKAILDAPRPPEATDEVETAEFHVDVQSKSTGKTKRYDATHVSTSKSRNAELLAISITSLVNESDAAKRAAIRTMIDALLDTFK